MQGIYYCKKNNYWAITINIIFVNYVKISLPTFKDPNNLHNENPKV
jgi:hypothetical protein